MAKPFDTITFDGYNTNFHVIHLRRHGIISDCDVTVDADSCCGVNKIQIGVKFIHGISASIRDLFSNFLNQFKFHDIERITNGCLYIVVIRCTLGCTRTHPCTPLALQRCDPNKTDDSNEIYTNVQVNFMLGADESN